MPVDPPSPVAQTTALPPPPQMLFVDQFSFAIRPPGLFSVSFRGHAKMPSGNVAVAAPALVMSLVDAEDLARKILDKIDEMKALEGQRQNPN